MKIPKYALVLIAIAAVLTLGNAWALIPHNDNVKVDGNFEVQKTTGPSAITVQNNDGFANSIKLWDVDSNQNYLLRLTGDGSRLDVFDVTDNRVDIAILSSNGFIGIHDTTPTETLDVNGNIRLTGNIVSPNDICIGNCP